MIHFLDTSVLAKRYVRETGSDVVRTLRGKTIAVARIVQAELFAAIARAAREGLLPEARRARLFRDIEEDFQEWNIVEIRAAIVHRVGEIVVRHPLRGYDAVQLAAALSIRDRGPAVQFWCADERLAEAATAEGLRTLVPR
jgi:predicted nucleic acid-binding protein